MRKLPVVSMAILGIAMAQLQCGSVREQAPPSTPPPMKGYVCYRASQPVVLDGKLDDPAWQAVPWTDYFEDIEGSKKPAPRFSTRAKMLWDDQYFYVGAELQEPHVWATLVKRDTVIFRDNDFEVFIDPNGDNIEYYEFEMNALNTVWDLLLKKPYRDGGPAVDSWNIAGLRTAVHVDGTINDPRDTDHGWSVEIAFPWAALKEYAHRPSPPNNGDQWRVNFSRVEWQITIDNGAYHKVPNTPEDNWVWSPQGIIDMHWPEFWGYVQFSTAAPGTAQFVPDPARGVRRTLLGVYYAEKKFHRENNRWTASMADLGLDFHPADGVEAPPVIVLTDTGFVATAMLNLPGGKRQQWHIEQDSRLWQEE